MQDTLPIMPCLYSAGYITHNAMTIFFMEDVIGSENTSRSFSLQHIIKHKYSYNILESC